MSNKNLARRAAVGISFAGTDITKSIKPYLKAFTYTDNEADEADDIQIRWTLCSNILQILCNVSKVCLSHASGNFPPPRGGADISGARV